MRGDSFECIEGAPSFNEVAKSVVWGEIGGRRRLFHDGPRGVHEKKQPFLDDLSALGNPSPFT